MVNTATLYRSPVRLVAHTAEDAEPYSTASISRARKKMMAEIALAGDEIVIDDVAYSRNDASTLLDVVTEDSWRQHLTIYNQKGLLQFLEKEEFNNEGLKAADSLLYNPPFKQAVSPYFAHSFNTASGRFIKTDNWEEAEKLLAYQGYILPEHSGEAYQKFRTYLDDLIYTLRNLSWEKFAADESVLHFIFSGPWINAINRLPSSFATVRDEVVEQLINLVLRFQHKATWHYLHLVLVQMKSIETTDFNRSEIERIDGVIYNNSQHEGRRNQAPSHSNDGEVSTGRIVWWIIWIALLLVRIVTCNNRSSDRYSFDSSPYQSSPYVTTVEDLSQRVNTMNEVANENALRLFLDSLGYKPLQNTVPEPISTGGQPFTSFANDAQFGGSDAVTVTNNSGFDCVLLYFKEVGNGSNTFAGFLTKTYAVYIKKGATQKVMVTAGNGRMNFIFGNNWARLGSAEVLDLSNKGVSITGSGNLTTKEGTQPLHVYNYFNGPGPSHQRYLHRNIYFTDSSNSSTAPAYHRLSVPGKAAKKGYTDVVLKRSGDGFTAVAKGRLVVSEDAVVWGEEDEATTPPIELAPEEEVRIEKVGGGKN